MEKQFEESRWLVEELPSRGMEAAETVHVAHKKQNEAECIEVELTTKLVLDKSSALNGLNSRWLTTKVHGNVDHASKMNVGTTSLMMSNPRRDDCFRVVHDSREGTRDSPTWTLSKVPCFQLAGTKDQLRIVKLIRHLS